jgi:DNA-binding NtrC family response regulator
LDSGDVIINDTIEWVAMESLLNIEASSKQSMLVLAESDQGKVMLVLKNHLPHLINEGRISKIRRSNEWLQTNADQRKKHADAFHGPERRVNSVVDWSLFALSIEQQLHRGQSLEAVVGYGRKAREIAQQLRNVAKTNLSVLIEGKTGTGKGVAALLLHELSKRKGKPFIRVDCGAIPPTLIESELFGHEKGSFTGAYRTQPGRFQLGEGGTVFLDEIANLSMDMQTRLLGFLEERVVNSVGGTRSIKLDLRIISATNVDLAEQIRRGQFRDDLFYRLNEFGIHMPSLIERSDDIVYLATKFLTMANCELEKNIFGFSEEAIDALSGYECRGNIRELKNVVKRAALLTDEVIEAEHLLSCVDDGETIESLDACLEKALLKGQSLHEITGMIRHIAEKRIIERTYEQLNNNKMRTSESLGIDYSTLFRKMREYVIK